MPNQRQQQHYLTAMGIQCWQQRLMSQTKKAQPAVIKSVEQPSVTTAPPAIQQPSPQAVQPDWETLQQQVAACTACELSKTRQHTVFGVGCYQADLLVIGEAPGAEEDRQGEPFVGRAGKLLDAMLLAIGLTRQQVFIANILKCRPPDNRDPRPEEIRSCHRFLQHQIQLIQPKVILAAGRIAAQSLLETQQPIGRLRGRQHVYGSDYLPLIPTYHPAYLLRSPSQKAKSWQDLLLVKGILSA